MDKARVGIIGASGYGGAELVRLVATHPGMEITALSADRRAGEPMAAVFPHLRHLDLPLIGRVADLAPDAADLYFTALPHATAQEVVAALPRTAKVVDLSADFRLRDPAAYAAWYGRAHEQPDLLAEAVYGYTEVYREEIRGARLVAGTGCNAITAQLPVTPLLAAGLIDPDEIIISLAAGVSGAGRGAKEGSLHAEVSESVRPYAIAGHRHMAEFEQEFSKTAGRPVSVTFIPHLLPQNRGILATVFLRGDATAIHSEYARVYKSEPFVRVLPLGEAPATGHVRGSNFADVGVVADRRAGRAIAFCATDNLMKGASGQAVQNANLMLGLAETMGLDSAPLYP